MPKFGGDMKSIVLAAFLLSAPCAFGAVNCVGVPQNVKVGEFGNQEGYLIVTINGLDFRLGPIGDSGAKSRLALASVALAANKPLMLRFWDPYADCNSASTAYAIPDSTQIVGQ